MGATRRRFVQGVGVAGLGLLAGCGQLPWQAQPSTKVFRIGFLTGEPTTPGNEIFRQGLREFGYVEGQNINIEYRFMEGVEDRLPLLAAELVSLQVDVIVAVARAALAAKDATPTIPIVMTGMNDPVGTGIVASLSRPGSNVTGLSLMAAPLGGKRLEILKQVLPGMSRLAVLWNNSAPMLSVTMIREIEDATRTLGLHLIPVPVYQADDLENAFEFAIREYADALIVEAGSLTFAYRSHIIQLAAKSSLPAMYELRAFAEIGGLMSYGADSRYSFRRAAYYVDRILKGASPADLPIEQPMRFDFVVNLKTAQTLGLTIPHQVLLQATEVIQ